MKICSIALWAAPLLLPIFAIAAATIGLGFRLNNPPDLDNLAFVIFCTVISGIVPTCVVLGMALLIAELVVDERRPYSRPILVGVEFLLACVIMVVSYSYGQGLYF